MLREDIIVFMKKEKTIYTVARMDFSLYILDGTLFTNNLIYLHTCFAYFSRLSFRRPARNHVSKQRSYQGHRRMIYFSVLNRFICYLGR